MVDGMCVYAAGALAIECACVVYFHNLSIGGD